MFYLLGALIVILALGFGFMLYIVLTRILDESGPKRKNVPGYAKPVEREDEYSRLLTTFGLTDSATEDQIKAAYRAYVKEHHPDTADDKDPEHVQKFMEIKKVYNRILEMKKLRF